MRRLFIFSFLLTAITINGQKPKNSLEIRILPGNEIKGSEMPYWMKSGISQVEKGENRWL